MKAPHICVVGAANIDLVSFTPRQPAMGETLHGDSFMLGHGGKAANQAVAAARLGAHASLIAKLGQDVFGEGYLRHLAACGVDVSRVALTGEAASGVAAIAVDRQGRNAIIVIPGANGLLSPADVEAASQALTSAAMLVCQLEVPIETTLAALRLARRAGVPAILNPAPALPDFPAELFPAAELFCPNEYEAAMLMGGEAITTRAEAEAAGRSLLARGARRVILTLGEHGSVLVTPDEVLHVSAPQVRAVDTTGAGDAYVGSLAFALATGQALPAAMRFATRVAAFSVQRAGTQASYPTQAELEDAQAAGWPASSLPSPS
jgi:ribokinase